MDFLKQFDLTNENLEELKKFLSNEVITNLDVMRHNVVEVLTYLKDYGVENFYDVLKYRPDLCLKEKRGLEQDLTTLDKELLLFIFNNNIDDLINFNI
ncbi:MAG: hypothetical protein PHX04_06000 [Bacilli bacterium]|nr:hypothetical protein [Bacilli bacterium]